MVPLAETGHLDNLSDRDSASRFASPHGVVGSWSIQPGPLSEKFLSPGSWNIIPHESSMDQFFDIEIFKEGTRTIRQWLRQWITEGSTAFIHPRLYHCQLPQCLQDAYISSTAYFLKGSANKEMINRSFNHAWLTFWKNRLPPASLTILPALSRC